MEERFRQFCQQQDKEFLASYEPYHDELFTQTSALPDTQNVVVTFSLGCEIDPKQITGSLFSAEYNPVRFAAVIVRLKDPNVTALLFSTGKVVIVGAKDKRMARCAKQKLRRYISAMGYPTNMGPMSLHNKVCNVDLGMPIDVARIRDERELQSTFEPETFPGLIYSHRISFDRVIIILIFDTGKVIMMGLKEDNEEFEAWRQVEPILRKYHDVRVQPEKKNHITGKIMKRIKFHMKKRGLNYTIIGGRKDAKEVMKQISEEALQEVCDMELMDMFERLKKDIKEIGTMPQVLHNYYAEVVVEKFKQFLNTDGQTEEFSVSSMSAETNNNVVNRKQWLTVSFISKDENVKLLELELKRFIEQYHANLLMTLTEKRCRTTIDDVFNHFILSWINGLPKLFYNENEPALEGLKYKQIIVENSIAQPNALFTRLFIEHLKEKGNLTTEFVFKKVKLLKSQYWEMFSQKEDVLIDAIITEHKGLEPYREEVAQAMKSYKVELDVLLNTTKKCGRKPKRKAEELQSDSLSELELFEGEAPSRKKQRKI